MIYSNEFISLMEIFELTHFDKFTIQKFLNYFCLRYIYFLIFFKRYWWLLKLVYSICTFLYRIITYYNFDSSFI